jgi:lipid-binding SYLF domain-containing protein
MSLSPTDPPCRHAYAFYTMNKIIFALMTTVALGLSMAAAQASPDAADYQKTIALFKGAGESASYFRRSYAYAVFPTVGEGGAFFVGGAGGKGGVFVHGNQVGETKMGQVSVGFQLGGKAYSEIIFFQDKSALDNFESGNFEFGADASVVAVTAGAGASAGTSGASAGASGGQKDSVTEGGFYKGMAVFTIAKGGLMYKAVIAGQKFTYHPLGS